MWKPIGSAPRDGRTVLLYRPGARRTSKDSPFLVETGYFSYDNKKPYWASTAQYWGVRKDRDEEPTHWQPVPEPPAPEE